MAIETQIDPIILSAIIVGIPTTVLAFITYLYMHETKLIRKSTYDPNFSISPISYILQENRIDQLSLVNSGQTAKDIKVHCVWNKVEKDGKKDHKYYIVSLGSNDNSILYEIPISELVKEKGKLTVKIDCKDSRNKKYKTSLEIDFEKISNENMTIAYQHDNQSKIIHALEEIATNIKSIEYKMGR